MKNLLLFVCVIFICCAKECEQTSENLIGNWQSENYTLNISEELAEICDKNGFCCGSNYYYLPETKTIFFCGNQWELQFNCKTMTATTQDKEVLVFEH